VRLVEADGSQAGIVPVEEALRRAQEQSLDLVEVAPTAKPPVCRIMDFGKFLYQQKKKATSPGRSRKSSTSRKSSFVRTSTTMTMTSS
jgi:translation initiation factor IF-3